MRLSLPFKKQSMKIPHLCLSPDWSYVCILHHLLWRSLEKTKTQGNSDLIPYTSRAVSLIESNIYRDPKRIITLHEGEVPLTKGMRWSPVMCLQFLGDQEKISALTRYYNDCTRRKAKAKEEREEAKKRRENEKKSIEETLLHFKHLIRVCQVQSTLVRSTFNLFLGLL